MSTLPPDVRPSPLAGRRLRAGDVIVGLCFAILLLAFGVMLLAPWIAPHDPEAQTLLSRMRPPFWGERALPGYVLGTDELGRDILSRTLYAVRSTLTICLIGTAIGMAFGTAIGLMSGLAGGWVDQMAMALVDVQIAVPFFLIAVTAIAIFGNTTTTLITVIGFAGWETYARLVRGQVLSVRESEYVQASQALGASQVRLAVVHVLPNIVSPLVVLATLNFSSILLLESSLSFLGLGIQPPTPSLGQMVGYGRDSLMTHPWVAGVPAVTIILLMVAISFLGDWVRDRIDARLR